MLCPHDTTNRMSNQARESDYQTEVMPLMENTLLKGCLWQRGRCETIHAVQCKLSDLAANVLF